MLAADRQRRVSLHRPAVIAPRHQRHRRPERAHPLEVRPPIGNARGEDRPEHRIRSNAVVESMDEGLDHFLVNTGARLNLGREGRPPRPSIAMINR